MTAHAARPALLLAVALTLTVSAWPVLVEGRAPSARDRYEGALVFDRDARATVDRGGADQERALQAARRAIAAYEAVVRRFPTSGYCDNALMRGGDLARWLFARSGRAADRSAAAKYYAWLIREYPGSGLRAQARTAARALESEDTDPTPRRAIATTPRRAPVALPTSNEAAFRAMPLAGSAPSPTAVAAVPVADVSVAAMSAVSTPATLRGIERSIVGTAVRVTLLLDRETLFAHELIDAPRRAFVDLFGATTIADLQDAVLRYDTDTVLQVRVGKRSGATRVVLDLDGASAVSVFTLYNPYRVVIDAERSGASMTPTAADPARTPAVAVAAMPTATVPALVHDELPAPPRDENEVVPAAASHATTVVESVDPVVPVALPSLVRPALAPATSPPATLSRRRSTEPAPESGVEQPAPVPAEPAVNGDGSLSLARQLGLGISRIVIDAGHGGHDPGTLTEGSTEARVVLDVALRLEKLLKKEPGLDVVLTRRTDVFIPLEQRTAIANREGADLFLSIHANASRNRTARGVETYFLSFASNPEAEAVAARENAASANDMHNLPSIVRAIALNNKLDESRDLAGVVQQSLSTRLSKANVGVRSRGVKKAPFVVLIGAGMPSVLAEIGFLTNKQESALLRTTAYRQRIAEALQAAVMQYRRGLKPQTSVAAR